MSNFSKSLMELCVAAISEANGDRDRELHVLIQIGANLSTIITHIGNDDPALLLDLAEKACAAIRDSAKDDIRRLRTSS